MKKLSLVIVLIMQVSLAMQVQAVGIGVKPSFLELDISKGADQTAKLTVYNVSSEAAWYRVYADELSDWITIEPANFRLEASETKQINVIVQAVEEGRQVTNLSVVASPLDKRVFNADSGVKIPLRLNIESNDRGIFSNFYVFMAIWFVICLVLICLVIFIVLKLRKKTFKEKIVDKVEDVFSHKKHWWK